MYDILMWVATRYGNPLIYVTENGVDVPGESQLALKDALEDDFRVNFYTQYLNSVKRAQLAGVNVRGYFAWSLLVRIRTYSNRFDIYHVLNSRIIMNGLMATTCASE
jgi:beta-glucosidase